MVDLTDMKNNIKTVNNKTEFGDNPMFSKAICFEFDEQIPMTLMIKHRLNAEFVSVSLKKKGNSRATQNLKKRPSKPNTIDKKKLDDVKKLLPFIPEVYHHFYNQLQENNTKKEKEDNNVEVVKLFFTRRKVLIFSIF